MAVASKSSSVSTRKPQVASKARAAANSLNPQTYKVPQSRQSNQTMPIPLKRRSLPLWLLYLQALQRHSNVVMFMLITGMLTIYGFTVYSQKMWSQAYNQLETLQRHERQLTTTNEVLKNKMAVQAADPQTQLMLPNPTQAIILQPSPQRPARTGKTFISGNKTTASTTQTNSIPLGY